MYGVGGAGKVESPIFRADSIKVGDVTVKNVAARHDEQPLLDLILDGILGPSLLSDFVVTIDYPRSQIELVEESSETGTVDSRMVFQRAVDGACRRERKAKGNFLIDTGADSTLLAHSMAKNSGRQQEHSGRSSGSAHRGHRRAR